MRYLVKRIPSTSLVHYDGSRYYCEIAGGTAEKATVDTADLLSGSKYLDVQTGNWYVYDELSDSWALSQEGGSADPAVIEQAVTDWLDAHPEATTTVADGSITEAKLASAVAQKVNAVTTLSEEIADLQKLVVENTATGEIASFSDGADGLPVSDLVVALEPVQSGSGDPSPDNVRPITGHTGVTVTRTGKNLLDFANYTDSSRITSVTDDGNGTFTVVASGASAYLGYLLSVKPNQVYVIYASMSANISGNASQIGMVNVYDGADSTATRLITNVHIGTQRTFTPSGNQVFVRLSVTGGIGAGTGTITTPRINIGTLQDYEAYQGQTKTVNWQTEAGTVYGGELNLTTGVLTVNKANIASYNGEALPGEWISDRDVYAEGTTPTTGAQVVYTLATPLTYTLTAEQMTTLLGGNNFWSTSGESSVSVTYKADTKKYIDGKFAELSALIAAL